MLCTAQPGGMSQVVAALRDCGLFDQFEVELIATHRQTGFWRRVFLAIKALARFIQLLARSRVAVVHAHIAMRGSFWRKSVFLAMSAVFGVPYIIHLHGSEFVQFYERECGRFRRALIRRVFRHAQTVIVLSVAWRQFVTSVCSDANVVVIHNFVDSARLLRAMAASGATPASARVLFLGELGLRKGIYDLVKSMAQVVAVAPDATLVAGGSGDIDGVRRLASELGISRNVVLPGWVTGAEKARLLAEAWMLVLPSYNEGLPMSILEAMTAGLPIVTTPVGGIPDAIHDGEEGFLVTPGAVDDLADRITRLIADPELRRSMGDRARETAANRFSSEIGVSAIASVYERCGVPRRAIVSGADTSGRAGEMTTHEPKSNS